MERPCAAEQEPAVHESFRIPPPRTTTGLEIVSFSSSSRLETYLACLPSGRVLEISGLLRDMLLLMDGSRSSEEIAARLSASGARRIPASQVNQTLEKVLCPNGLVAEAEGEGNPPQKTRTPGAKTQGIELCPARLLIPYTRRLGILFHRPVFLVSLTLITLCMVVLFHPVLLSGRGTWPARLCPEESGILYLLILLSVLFHELGHLSACTFHGCRHGELRFGLYLIFPVFYSNVTRAWSLPRRARIAVDLGGIYFQMLLAIPALAAYWITSRPVWIYFCLALVSMAAFALNPFLRFDGYWLCSDLLGVPNLRARSRLYLQQILLRALGGKVPPSTKIELRRLEQIGLLLYGILSHLFFLLGFAWLMYFLAGRIGGLSASLGSAQRGIVQALRQGDVRSLVAILLQVLFSWVFIVAACRALGQGLVGIVRILLRGVRKSPAAFERENTKGGRFVMKRKRARELVGVILLSWTFLVGCGGDASGRDPVFSGDGGEDIPKDGPEAFCESLGQSKDPGSGGDFACLYCSRIWQWDVPEDSGPVCFRVEILCNDAEGTASLRVVRPDSGTLWERGFRAGEGGSFCVTDENPIQGVYRVELSGEGPMGLIPSFHGSVWIRVYAQKEGLLESRKARPAGFLSGN